MLENFASLCDISYTVCMKRTLLVQNRETRGFIPLLTLCAVATSGWGCAGVGRYLGGGEARAARQATEPQADSEHRSPGGAAALIEEALHGRGLQFGTDGSVEALYAYSRERHQIVSPQDARVGDLVFFNTTDDREHCGSHGGIVEGVREGGTLSFREYRDGRVRRSMVDPGRPRTRRDSSGRIINSFLRPKRPNDPTNADYFAGEMLCAVARVTAQR